MMSESLNIDLSVLHAEPAEQYHARAGEYLSSHQLADFIKCPLLCQARFDWVHPHRGISDLKTCDDLTWFESDARRYGYHRQMAFYRAVLAQPLAGLLVPVHLIAVEKKQPFRCGVWRVGEDTLAVAQRENEAAIGRLLDCRRQDHWPTGYEEVRMLEIY